jgi:hypothetical protein
VIALAALRLRLTLRFLLRARDRALGLLIVIPANLFMAFAGSAGLYLALSLGEAQRPEAVGPLLALAATLVGLTWAFAPLLSGVSLVELHDITRLLVYPIPLHVLVASSFLSNLVQPGSLVALPMMLAFALGLGGGPLGVLGALVGALLTYLFIVASAELVGLLLYRVARDRRLQDLSLFLGLGFGLAMSALPLVLVAGRGGRSLARAFQAVIGSRLLLVSPFSWGVRAGLAAARGEGLAFLLFLALATSALGAVLAGSTLLIRSIASGDLDVGPAPTRRLRRSGLTLFPGALGALFEKDLRLLWREPALRAMLLGSLIGPVILVVFLSSSQGRAGGGGFVLGMGSFVGLSNFGANAFGFERRGIGLLLSFETPRWKILLAKNLGALVFRMPGLLALFLAELAIAPLVYLVPAFTIALVTFFCCVGIDNYMSILFPTAAPPPGQSPYGGAYAGSRGLGTVLLGSVLFAASLLASSPFVFLCWLPSLVEAPLLWLATLPVALTGALAVYAMLLGGAAKLLAAREPDLLERVLGEV